MRFIIRATIKKSKSYNNKIKDFLKQFPRLALKEPPVCDTNKQSYNSTERLRFAQTPYGPVLFILKTELRPPAQHDGLCDLRFLP